MPKVSNSSGTRLRAARRLEPYNKSPVSGERSRSRSRHESQESTRERDRASTAAPAEDVPPSWARDLLEQQKQYAKELKKMKNELNAAKRSKPEKSSDPEQEFRFEGNKKQYKVNQNVLEKISEARNASDDEERSNLLLEGEKLLLERNKHICLADKYGWDTVECYTAEPLASDSSHEAHQKSNQREQTVAGRETEDVDGKVEDEKVATARRKTKTCCSRKIEWFFSGGKVVQLSVT